jgi:CysZ protein
MAGSFFVMSFLKGFWAPLNGLGFLWRNRALWKFVWIPMLINVVVFVGLGTVFVAFFSSLIHLLLPQGDAWYWAVLSVLLWVVGSLLLVIFFLFAFTVVGNMIGGPFNDVLSERVERMVRGDLEASAASFGQQVRYVGRSAVESLKLLLFYLVGWVVLLLWNLIPGLGTVIYAVTTGAWTFLFLALEFGDYYLARHWIRFRARWSRIWTHRWASLGFGAGSALLLVIPLLNLLLIPAAVTGATLLWLRLTPPEESSEPVPVSPRREASTVTNPPT